MAIGGTSGSVAPSNAQLVQPDIMQHWHNFEQSIDAFAYHQNTDTLGAQRGGKQQVQQQRDAGISGKRKAIEMEKQQHPGTLGEGQGQPADLTDTEVMAPRLRNRKRYQYDDSIANEFEHVTKSVKGDGSFHCTACNRDMKVSTMGMSATIVKHQKTDMHKNAMAQNGPLSTDHNKVLTIFDSNGKQFGHITTSAKGDGFVHCTACNRDIKLSTMGMTTAIRGHQNTAMHKNAITQLEPEPTQMERIWPNFPQVTARQSQNKETGIRIGATSSNAGGDVDTHGGGKAPIPIEQRKKDKTHVVLGDRGKGKEIDLNLRPVEETEEEIDKHNPSSVLPIEQIQNEEPQREIVVGSVEPHIQGGSSDIEIERNKLKEAMDIIKEQLAFSSWKKPLDWDEINKLQREYAGLKEKLKSMDTEDTSLGRQ